MPQPWQAIAQRFCSICVFLLSGITFFAKIKSVWNYSIYQYSDRELVEQLTEDPYYQYFIGLLGYQEESPIDASTLVLFRKRLKMDVIMEANEYMLEAVKEKESGNKKDDDHTNPPSG